MVSEPLYSLRLPLIKSPLLHSTGCQRSPFPSFSGVLYPLICSTRSSSSSTFISPDRSALMTCASGVSFQSIVVAESCAALVLDRRSPHSSAPARPRSSSSRPCPLCYCSWKEKRQSVSLNQFRIFCLPTRVLSSLEPQEAREDSTVPEKNKLLIDCGPEQECVLGGIIALGKFDALHIGHRQLVIQAAHAGAPFLLSFVGIAEVLGWTYRAPIVAQSDRKHIFSSWASYCGNVVPHEYQIDFASVRYLSPREFVERLSVELGVAGVVAGENYRFGYGASGDASDLVRLCEEYGLESYIVSPVMDDYLMCRNGTSTYTTKKEKVSSTRVRRALAMGDMTYVQYLLGRKHRLVFEVCDDCIISGNKVSVPKSCMLNQPPKEDLYEYCSLVIDDKFVGPCRVLIDSENICVEFLGEVGSLDLGSSSHQFVSVEFD